MSRIHLLTEEVCNRIAAGEVVERPSSVVKELVENSLDAGARKISVSVEKAGQKSILVRDNGEGMDTDDALLCLESHATSKIKKEEDIFAITSFGFRGEALPSIASVSRFQIRTRRRDAQEGTEVTVNGGTMVSTKPVGCAPGTEVSVKDLFFNIPARRKFMRSTATEERHILECITNISLSNPDVAFELKLDNRIAISSPAAPDLTPRLRELFGKSCADALIPVIYSEYGIQVEGYISRRDFTRNTRNEQRTFVNGRCVEALAIYKGIREGYGPMLEKGRYPLAILFITINPGEVDVNVHPAKREVRFRHEYELTATIRSAVAKALREHNPVTGVQQVQQNEVQNNSDGYDIEVKTKVYNDFRPSPAPEDTHLTQPNLTLDEILMNCLVEYRPGIMRVFPERQQTVTVSQTTGIPQKNESTATPDDIPDMLSGLLTAETDTTAPEEEEPAPFRLEQEDAKPHYPSMSGDFQILGTLENSYIIGTIPNGMILIDQHAAHERILYEQILRGIDGVHCQKLLLPITVEVSRADMLFVSRNASEFEKLGFEIEPFGTNTLKLNGIPAAIKQNNAGGIFQDILSRLTADNTTQKNVTERIARAACKAAVKAHEILSREECIALVKELAKCELPFSCPHGRPTMLNISLSEVERRFGRK